MTRRGVSDEEKALFRRAVEQGGPRAVMKRGAKKRPSRGGAGGQGLDAGTGEKLRRGALAPAARIDLHGHTEAAAYRMLLASLERAHKQGRRLVLVITGKGNPGGDADARWTPGRYGVLKEMVPRWLNEPAFAALIAYAGPAHPRHGGDGALYVYLRKPG